jgi:hypothetical protein
MHVRFQVSQEVDSLIQVSDIDCVIARQWPDADQVDDLEQSSNLRKRALVL